MPPRLRRLFDALQQQQTGQQLYQSTAASAMLEIDAAEDELAAAVQAARLYDPRPGFARPLMPQDIAETLPEPLERAQFATSADPLRQLADLIRSPAYETFGPYAVGGPTGTYQCSSPLSTAGEWSMIGFTFSAVGTAWCGITQSGAPAATSVYNGGTNGAVAPALIGYPLAAPGATSQAVGPIWTPCLANDVITVQTNLASGFAVAIIAFRRVLGVDGQPAQSIYG